MSDGLSIVDFAELLASLRRQSYGQWSRADLERVAAEMGWSIVDVDIVDIGEEMPPDFPRGLCTLPRLRVQAPLSDTPLGGGAQRQFSELKVNVLPDASPTDFRQFEDTITGELGIGPTMWGGPGPFVRWEDPANPALTFAIELDGGSMYLSVCDTEGYEEVWFDHIEHGERCMWMALSSPRSPFEVPVGKVTSRWQFDIHGEPTSIEAQLAATLAVLAHDVRVLGDGMSVVLSPANDSHRYVRFLINEDDAKIIAEASMETEPRPNDAQMVALGWRPDRMPIEPGNWWQAFDGLDTAQCLAAAHLIVTTLQAYGAEPPEEDWLLAHTQHHSHLTYRPNYVSRTRPAAWIAVWALYIDKALKHHQNQKLLTNTIVPPSGSHQ